MWYSCGILGILEFRACLCHWDRWLSILELEEGPWVSKLPLLKVRCNWVSSFHPFQQSGEVHWTSSSLDWGFFEGVRVQVYILTTTLRNSGWMFPPPDFAGGFRLLSRYSVCAPKMPPSTTWVVFWAPPSKLWELQGDTWQSCPQGPQGSVKTPQRQLFFHLFYILEFHICFIWGKGRAYCLKKKKNWKPVPSVPCPGEGGGGEKTQRGKLTCLRSHS